MAKLKSLLFIPTESIKAKMPLEEIYSIALLLPKLSFVIIPKSFANDVLLLNS